MKKSDEFIKLCEEYDVDPDLIPEVKSFEEACAITGDDPTKLPAVDGIAERHRKRILADYKLSIIADALRGGKYADYTDDSDKWFAVFTVQADKERPSGFALSYDVCDYWYSFSHVGVRLCFPEYDIAEFFGRHFIDLHTDHHLMT